MPKRLAIKCEDVVPIAAVALWRTKAGWVRTRAGTCRRSETDGKTALKAAVIWLPFCLGINIWELALWLMYE